MSRVFFLNRFYWPEEPATAQLLADLATALAGRGHRVTVIASHPADAATADRETHDGVLVERVRTTRWGGHRLAGRAIDFATFYPGALWRLFRLARRGDTVVALTDPPLIGLFAWVVTWLRRATLIHWVQDIYPEVAVELSGQRWLYALRPFRNFTWRRAAACIVPGSEMANTLERGGVERARIVVSPNWAPAGLAPPPDAAVRELRQAWGLEGKFVAVYSGNLGRVHDLDPLLEVAAALRDDPSFAFVFIGQGPRRAALESAARVRSLAQVQFRPPQARRHLAVSLGLADAHFITLRPGAERGVFPSKLYGIARVGRPVLFVGRRGSELARLVETRGLGAAFDRDETVRIVETLRAWRANPARVAELCAAARRFAPHGLDDAVSQWHQAISPELAARPGPR